MSEESTFKVGHLERVADGFEGRLERVFEGHDAAEVWRMLTEPAEIAKWLAPGTIEPRQGGRVHIDFADSGIVIDSTVLEFQPQRVLAYSWSSGDEPQRPLRFALEPVDGGNTRLVLTVKVPADEDASKACAGFEGHLEILTAALEGVPIKFPFQVYQQARAAYTAQLEGK